MKKDDKHSDLTAVDRQSKTFFSGGEFRWEKSKAEVWAELEAQIDDQSKGRIRLLNPRFVKWMAAASILILFSLGSFIRFYSVTVDAPAGRHVEFILPDESTVNLNAESSVSYHPYWWFMSRKLDLVGEAFFEVKKGKRFSVHSEKGITQVLGTSFNILAREEIYTVTCVTGTVKVKSRLGFEAIIRTNSKAEVGANGEINVSDNIETFPEISWKKNIFLFTAMPVHAVFAEIERQYGVSIHLNLDQEALYTGNFTKNQHVEEILEYVCPALGLKFEKTAFGEYLISAKDE